MVWNHNHAEALMDVFEILDGNNIKWMIMRNYEGLPENNTSKDIDIAISRTDWNIARELIYSALREKGFSYVLFTRFQSILCHTFYKFMGDEVVALKIDIFACYEWRGAEYISFDNLYGRSRIYNGMHVPDDVMDAIMLFLKPLLLGGVIKEKYEKKYREILLQRPQEANAVLSKIIGKKEAKYLLDLIKMGKKDEIIKRYRIVRRKLWVRNFGHHPLRTLARLIQHYWIEARRRIFTHRNNIFAVLGTDGVGKSTFLELWKEMLIEHVPMEKKSIEVLHFRPNILPNIKKLLLGKRFDESKENFNMPHRSKPVGTISSLIRLEYYWIDYIIGVPMKLRSARLNGKYVIFDRYFHDFLVDPYRARIKLPYYIRAFLFKFIYKPRITFILLADAKTIYQRKQELELDEIERQILCYKMLLNEKNILELDATQKPEEIAKQAFHKFIMKVGERI